MTCFQTTNMQRSAIYSQQITILGLISIFRANIYYFETDFCEDFCSLLVAIGVGQSSQKGTFYAIIIAAILSHPPVFFFRIFNKLRIFSVRCSVFRNDAVPVFRCSVFRCSVVPVFLVLLIAAVSHTPLATNCDHEVHKYVLRN